MKPIKDFLTARAKSMKLTDLYFELTNLWEEDRSADGEWLFDLHTEKDAKTWIEMYGTECYVNCYNQHRYWWGGWQFAENEKDKARFNNPCVINGFDTPTEQNITNILNEIVDLVEFGMKNSNLEIETANAVYKDLIDFEGYFSQEKNKDIEDYIRKVYEPCGDFDIVDMDIELSEEVNTLEGNHIDFYWVKCTKNGKPCDMAYSCIKFNGIIYLPLGERDCYPYEMIEICNYQWAHTENGKTDNLYFDKRYNLIHKDEQKLMWEVGDMLGEDYAPNFFNKNDSLEDMRDEIIQEFTICLYDIYKDHIQARDWFFQYCRDCAIHFISIYNHTDFSEENCSYYDYVDRYIEKLCSKNMVEKKDWWQF